MGTGALARPSRAKLGRVSLRSQDTQGEFLDSGDIFAISEGVLLGATWAWTLRVKREWHGWREKAALFGFVSASIAIFADLILTVVMHFRGESMFAGVLFLVTAVGGSLLGLAAMILGIVGKGTPRIAALAWSLVILGTAVATLFMIASQAHDG